MINNLDIIKPLLSFENPGDFYMLYIFKRKKDQPEGEKDNHQSVRTIKTYCIESVEHLEKRWDEITHLCEYFKARAYIHIQGQNHKDVSLDMLMRLAENIKNNHHNQKNLFDSVAGQIKVKEKRWIVDVDTKDHSYLHKVVAAIESCKPFVLKNTTVEYNDVKYPAAEFERKIIEQIPTKAGYHFITKPFDFKMFVININKIGIRMPDVQKKNPTLLFLPDSLSN